MFTQNRLKTNPLLLKTMLNESKRREIEDLFNESQESQVREVPGWQKELEEELKSQEGLRNKTYIPTPGDVPTIGYGHTGKYAKPGAYITDDQAESLLKSDIQDREPKIKNLMPEFEVFPTELQVPLASSYFRGSLGGSPKTVKHINAGEFKKAADEFLNNAEYKNAKANGRPGIRPRMERTSNALRKFGTGQHPSNTLIPGIN